MARKPADADEPREPRPRPSRPDLDAIFGDVLPGTTSDERDDERPEADRDSWYEGNRPPHHDRD